MYNFVFFWKTSDVYGCFSNWYLADFISNGIKYNCSEQYMMHHKALLFKDNATAKKILDTTDPKEQKKLGREVKNFDKQIWDKKAKDIVFAGCYSKFYQNEKLLAILLSTGNKVLVEASPYDKIWGIGLAYDDPRALNKDYWLGTNWLGETLMSVRKDLSFRVEVDSLSMDKEEIVKIVNKKIETNNAFFGEYSPDKLNYDVLVNNVSHYISRIELIDNTLMADLKPAGEKGEKFCLLVNKVGLKMFDYKPRVIGIIKDKKVFIQDILAIDIIPKEFKMSN